MLDNLSTGFRWAVPDAAKFVEGDVGDSTRSCAGCSPAIAVDAIIHFAGSIVVPESIADPLGYYLNNTCKSRSLIASAVEANVPHFIFSSTAAVYGMPKENPVAENAAARADLALRYLEADDRDHAARHGKSAPAALCGLALFQCRRRRSAWAKRAIDSARDASHQGRVRNRARGAALSRSVRHRLSRRQMAPASATISM